MTVTFKESFCRHHRCKLDDFERLVFRRTLRRRARPFAWLIQLLNPGFFHADFQAIRQLGAVTNQLEACAEIDAYADYNQTERNFWHDSLRFRVSGRLMLQLAVQFLPPHPHGPNVTHDRSAGRGALDIDT